MYLFLIIGMTGQGKTFYTRKKLENKRCLVFDVNNEYGDVNKSLANKPEYIPFQPCEEVRSIDKIPPRARYTGGDYKEFSKLCTLVKNTSIVVEDATGFLIGSIGKQTSQLIVKKRHTGNVFYFFFHSINSIPPRLVETADFVVLFKTGDDENRVKRKFVSLYTPFMQLKKGIKQQPILIDNNR